MAEAGRAALPCANSCHVEEQLAWRLLSARNGDRLRQIMNEYGWPTFDMVGEEAARSAWLIAQHADRQLEVQRQALNLMEQAVTIGQAHPRDLAFLRDRVLVNEGHKQLYGTQIADVEDGIPIPWPCQDPSRVDQLRAEVGIAPFADCAGRFLTG
ncbi:hypothetical protein PJ985_19610 [Streptomyces sp. ACA25]|uniref:DUF6624 domain-containing protein n=1 Tax=Streptomyces sp. ACA25 TaxID=3022596 RepID=UPI002306F37E|nr:DUF6624 domain-containing protein [Streptomyces sp. ACA25]MDB1089766.1 hypothetical protein [Streptomyces sp. ACA25]